MKNQHDFEPYYAVIFTSTLNENIQGYQQMSEQMVNLASEQDGFIAFETASGTPNISISYWKNLESIKKWKGNTKHLAAQQKGKSDWYRSFKVRIAKVEREYEFEN